VERTSSDRLLDEHGNTGEELEDLHLNVASWAKGAAEHRWATNDYGAWAIPGRHVLDEILKGLEDTGVLVCRHDKRIAFLLQHGCCALDGRIDEGHDLETTAELASVNVRPVFMWNPDGLLFETERVVPRAFVGAKHDISCSCSRF
jgi:hypothetical protein